MANVNLRVVDVYQGDNVSDFNKAAQDGVWGIIHKASTGATGWDRKYAERRPKAVAAGLLWGAYHWGTGIDVKRQVDNFLKRAQPDDKTLVALDYEDDPNQMTLEQAREFLTRISERLGRKAVLYSGHVAKDNLGKQTGRVLRLASSLAISIFHNALGAEELAELLVVAIYRRERRSGAAHRAWVAWQRQRAAGLQFL